MAAHVKHSESGIYSIACKDEVGQIIVNGLTLEKVVVDRTEIMVASSVYYIVNYNQHGWAYLGYSDGAGKPKKKWLNTLGFKLTAMTDGDGHLAIHNADTGTSVWVDDKAMKDRITRTIKITKDKSITFTAFGLQRNVDKVRIMSPHIEGHTYLGLFAYWDFLCLKQFLDIDYGGDPLAEVWTRKNFHLSKAKWDKEFGRAEGLDVQHHWFRSEDSWKQHHQACNATTMNYSDITFRIQYIIVMRGNQEEESSIRASHYKGLARPP